MNRFIILMRKHFLFVLLVLFPVCLLASGDNSENEAETGIKKEKGKVYIKESEIYPYITIEQNPPVAAIRGFIKGNINDASLTAYMTKLAGEYNLAGWMRKTPEGSIQFHLQGLPENVKTAVTKIPICDPASKIETVESKTAVVTKYMKGFKTIDAENQKGD
jgi:acylphosphatase